MNTKRYQLGELAAEIRLAGCAPFDVDTMLLLHWAHRLLRLFPSKQTKAGYEDFFNFDADDIENPDEFIEEVENIFQDAL